MAIEIIVSVPEGQPNYTVLSPISQVIMTGTVVNLSTLPGVSWDMINSVGAELASDADDGLIIVNGQTTEAAVLTLFAGAEYNVFGKIAASSALDSPGAETAHTVISLEIPSINTAGTVLDFYARLEVGAASGGPDTWRMRAYVGAAAADQLIADSTAYVHAAGDVVVIRGTVQIVVAGAAGYYNATTEVINYTAGTVIRNEVTGVVGGAGLGGIDTTSAKNFTITGLDSAGGAPGSDIVTLTDFHVSVKR